MPRLPSAYAVEALLDRGEALLDDGLVLGVGEDVGPVIFDCLANQFADIERIDAIVDPFLKRLDELGERSFRRRRAADLPREPLRHIPPRIHDLSEDDARRQNGYPAFPHSTYRPQSFGQRHYSIFAHI